MQILEYEDERPLEAQFDADLAEDFEGFCFDGFGIGKGGRRAGVLDAQQMQQHGAVLIGIHPDPLQTRADLLDDRTPGCRSRGCRNCCAADRASANTGSRCRRKHTGPRSRSRARLPSCRRNSERSRDLPMPGSPTMPTACRLAAFDLPQEIVQDRQIALPVDEGCPASCRGRPEGGARLRYLQQPVGGDRIGLTFEDERTDRFDPSIALRQFVSRLAQQDRRRLGGLLNPGRDIGGVADRRIIHRKSIGDWAEHHRPGVDADPHRQVQFIGAAGVLGPAERPLDRQGRRAMRAGRGLPASPGRRTAP